MIEPQQVSNKVLTLLDTEAAARCLAYGNREDSLASHNCPECLHDRFEQHAAESPTRIALHFDGAEMSYGELNDKANQLAHRLLELGVSTESIVGIYLERGYLPIVCVLAVLKAGGAYVGLDTDQPVARAMFMIEDCKPVVILTSAHLSPRLQGLNYVVEEVECFEASGEWKYSGASTDNIARSSIGLAPDNLAYVVYTSGSTGNPKGVMVEHFGVPRLFDGAQALRIDSSDVWTLFHSLSFDFSVWELWGALLHGGKLVIVPPKSTRSPDDFYDLIRRTATTIVSQTPSSFKLLTHSRTRRATRDQIRLIVCAGELLELQTVKRWFDSAPDPNPIVANMYGATESTVHATLRLIGRDDVSEAKADNICGLPMPGYSLYILDDARRLVPLGAAGEIYIGGRNVIRGYLNRQELTSERFVFDPFSGHNGARLYKTGDIGRWLADGDLQYLGRNDFQLKIRGYRVELGEIEAKLLTHPGIRDAVVIARDITADSKQLVAYVVPRVSPTQGTAQTYTLPNGREIFHLNRGETEFLYREIFESALQLRHGISLPRDAVVFDVGANIGLFALYIAEKFPESTTFALEPLPPIVDVLRMNSELCGSGAVKVIPAAAADVNGTADFVYYPANTIMSKMRSVATDAEDRDVVQKFIGTAVEAGRDNAGLTQDHMGQMISHRMKQEIYKCQQRRLSDVFADEGIDHIDLLKIDAERSEWSVLLGMNDDDWPKIDQVVVEVHDHDSRTGQTGKARQIAAFLEGHGYSVALAEDEVLKGVGLFHLYAVRPLDQKVPRAVCGLAKSPHEPLSLTSSNTLRRFLGDALPDYMVPAAYVQLPVLPLTPNGKLDRKALPAPGPQAVTTEEYEAPRGAVEEKLAAIWSEILRVTRIGRNDDFFLLGGHSLSVMRMTYRVSDVFHIAMSPAALFQDSTFVSCAKRIKAEIWLQESEHQRASMRSGNEEGEEGCL